MRSFWSKVDSAQAWHASIIDKPWLQPLKPTKFVIVLIILSTLIAAGMNWYVRHWQYQVWEQNPKVFYLDDGTPLFTTTDAPYFLGLAKAIRDEGNFQAFNEKRLYPSTKKNHIQSPPSNSLRDAPLLSVLLSLFSPNSSQKSLLETGNYFIPLTAALTAVMIVFAFGAAGYWLPGTIAAAGGGLSYSFLTRSGAGRIDTDQLNLGFFYLMTGMVIFAARAKTQTLAYLLTVVAGCVFWVFDWWYSKPSFGWVFVIGLFWFSFACHRNILRAAIQVVVFVTLSGLIFKGLGFDSKSAYFVDVLDYEGLIFPNTFDTITEVSKVEFTEILSRISGSVWLGGLSVIGLVFWGLRHPALAIVFGPAAAFALLNFLIGNRAIFYSAPMLWFGFGWVLITAVKLASEKFRRDQAKNAALLVSTLAIFVAVWFSSPTSYVQGPTFDKRIVKTFSDISKMTTSDNAVIATWWDYGYMSMFMNQMPTLHDGGAQNTPATFFIANSLLETSQRDAAQRLLTLHSFGVEGVIRSLSEQETVSVSSSNSDPLYLVLTADMSKWIGSIGKIGLWDISAGVPDNIPGVEMGYLLNYKNLECKLTTNPRVPVCDGTSVNLDTGKFGDNVILDGMVVSAEGKFLAGKTFRGSNSAFMLHSEQSNKSSKNMLIHKKLYFSVFHQLFHVGNVEKQYFQLVSDGFPYFRIFKVHFSE